MTSTRKLLGSAFLLAIVVGAFLLAGGDRDTSDSLLPSAEPAGGAIGSAGTAELSFEEGDAARNTTPSGLDQSQISGSRTEEDWDESELVWVRGSVSPRLENGGCLGADRSVTVYALHKATDQPVLRDRLFNETGLNSAGDPKPRARTIFARREIDESGEFRIPFPPDVEIGHLIALGDYESMSASQPIRLRIERSIVLSTTCGGFIEGRIASGIIGAEEVSFGSEEDFVSLSVDPLSAPSPMARAKYAGQKARIQKDGTFALYAVPPGAELQLDVHVGLLAMRRMDLDPVQPGEFREVEVELTAGGTISGIVVDEDGAPLEGVSVEARLNGGPLGFDAMKARKSKSDDRGRFTLSAVAQGRVTVVAEKEGWLETRPEADLEEALPLTFDLEIGEEIDGLRLVLNRGAEVAGFAILPDGSPAAGAEIRVSFDVAALAKMSALNAARGGSGRAIAAEDGSFRVQGLGLGPFTVSASLADPEASAPENPPQEVGATDDYSPSDLAEKHLLHWKARADSIQPGATNLELVLTPPSIVRGRVLLEGSREPMKEFVVHAQRIDEGVLGALSQPKLRKSFQGEDGRFEFQGLGSGNWKLTIDVAQYALPDTQLISIPRSMDAPDLEFALTLGATVSGFVRNPIGLSCPDAEVRTEGSRNAAMNDMEGSARELVARTGMDGSFRLDGLRPGSTALQATALGYASSLPVKLNLAPGEHRRSIEFALRSGGSIEGQVFDDEGEPSANRVVSLSHTKFRDTQTHRSDEEGRFRVDHLDPGTWQVSAIIKNIDLAAAARRGDAESTAAARGELFGALRMATAEVVDGQTTEVILGTPPGRRVEVSGRVTLAGEPFYPAAVTFVPEGEGLLEGMKFGIVKKNGEFDTILSHAGRYAVRVEQSQGIAGDQNAIEYFVEVPDQPEFAYDLEIPAGKISGKITLPDGSPAAQTRVTLVVEGALNSASFMGGHFYERQAEADGRFEVTGLRPGSYRIAVGGMPLGGFVTDSAVHGRLVRAGIEIVEGQHREGIDFILSEAKPGSVEVLVLDANSDPVRDAAVFARRKDGTLVDALSWALTGQDGLATYSGLEPGEYTVSVRGEDAASPLGGTPVEIAAGKTERIEIRVAAATRLVVSAESGSGEKTRAHYIVENEEGVQVQRMQSLNDIRRTVAKGGISLLEATFGPLPPGRYRVTATGPAGKTVTKPVKLSGQSERRMTLRLR